MKTSYLLLSAAVAAGVLLPLHAISGTFTYNYQTVFDANADTYIVGRQNVAKYSEWQSPPVTYWGPSANDVAASLTMHFSFAAPTTQISLYATLLSANWQPAGRSDYGYSSIWASTDGASWQLLLDDPTPTGPAPIATAGIYNQNVPNSLLGATDFWLQVRMWTTASLVDPNPAPYNWTDAQFSRYDPNNPPTSGNNFLLSVRTVPEPGAFGLGAFAVLATACRCRSRNRPDTRFGILD